MNRIVEPELLDELPPTDPRAIRSRRDLRRVNAWMRNHAIMAKVLMEKFSDTPKQITELGAGDGHFLLRVAEKLSRPSTNVLLLDRQKNVSAETLAAFSKIKWCAEAVTADVFEWNGTAEIVVANLFLHHFDDARLTKLLRNISERTKLFVAIEPHRFSFPILCVGLLWLIGCNAVTRHDAAVSIRAGFLGDEISALWPDKTNWRLTERRAGLFSHLFIARKAS
jgi:hypothetical protein